MIVDIVELLDKKDSNFSMLFDQASQVSKIKIMDKIAELEKNKARRVKTATCMMKYNRDIRGIEIRIDDFHICICEVEDYEMKDILRNEDEIKFAYIKTREDGNIVEYNYNLIYDGREFKLMPTVIRQGENRPRFSAMVDLTETDLNVLKGETVFHV